MLLLVSYCLLMHCLFSFVPFSFEGVNCVLDCLGDDVVDQNLKSLAVGGKLICIGYKDHWKWSSVEMKDLVSKDATIMGISY